MNRIKNILIFLLTIISVVYIYKYYSFETHVNKMVQSISIHPPTKSSRYTDDRGLEHVTVSDDNNSYTQKEAIRQSSFIKPYIDTLARALRVPTNQIAGATTMELSVASNKIDFLQRQVDSLKNVTYSYADKYLHLTVHSMSDTSTKSDFDFSYDADLNIVHYWKPYKFLGVRIRKDYYTDISMTDPRATIKGLSTFTVKQPNIDRFSLSASTRFTYGEGPSIGPLISVDIHPLTLRAGAYYNIEKNSWQPSIGADYKLISLK